MTQRLLVAVMGDRCLSENKKYKLFVINYGNNGVEFIVKQTSTKTGRALGCFLMLFACALGAFYGGKNVLAWFLLLGLLTAFLLWSLTRTVTEESLLVLRSLGIQVKKTFLFHNTVTRFMDMSEVTDVVINEGISLHQVVCYLSVLLSPVAETSPGGLFPLFLDTRPNLKELKEIYLTVQPFLSKRNIGS